MSTDQAPSQAASSLVDSGLARIRWREILFEAISIVAAVLLAFWVDAWRADRERDEQATALRSAVMREVSANRAELAEVAGSVAQTLEQVRALTSPRDGGQLDLSVDLALLSRAAYDVMQTAPSAASIDLTWRIRVARAYELQGLMLARQNRVVDAVSHWMLIAPGDSPEAHARELASELNVLQQLQRNLDRALAELEAG